MVSAVFDLLSLIFPNGSDLSYIVHLPSYASTAWYHNKIDNPSDSLAPFLEEVRRFTEDIYVPALYKGSRLSTNDKEEVAEQLARHTGLSADFWMRANLRVKASEFFAELLRDEGANVGRLDSRYRGISQNLLSQYGEYDPFTTSLGLPYTAAFLDYCYGTLELQPEHEYHISAYGKEGFKWNWDHKGNQSWGTTTSITTAPDLARTLTRNPYTKVLILNGYYDLGTPFYGVEYTLDQLGLTPEIRENIQMTYYEAGHMMYTDEASFDKMERDVKDFIRDTANK
jgi:carboxypeptidase C (cathepsin A)